MQDTATKSESVANQLKDKKLFREACYVNGEWIRAKSGGFVQVDNPATGEIIGSVPKLGAAVPLAGPVFRRVIFEHLAPQSSNRISTRYPQAVERW